MSASDAGIVCLVDGCGRAAGGLPVVYQGASLAFSGIQILLCDDHRLQYETDPTSWDGEVDGIRNRVVRMWRREGIDPAS